MRNVCDDVLPRTFLGRSIDTGGLFVFYVRFGILTTTLIISAFSTPTLGTVCPRLEFFAYSNWKAKK